MISLSTQNASPAAIKFTLGGAGFQNAARAKHTNANTRRINVSIEVSPYRRGRVD